MKQHEERLHTTNTKLRSTTTCPGNWWREGCDSLETQWQWNTSMIKMLFMGKPGGRKKTRKR